MNDIRDTAETGLASQALILGCGFLGARLGRLLRGRGVRVLVTTRSASRHQRLRAAGLEPYAVDLQWHGVMDRILDQFRNGTLDVFCLLPPSALAVHQDGCEPLSRLVAAFSHMRVRRALLTSSTAVYGDRAGAWVSAETGVCPAGPRAARLYAIERIWIEGFANGQVVRLAGLYGPDRIVGLSMLEAGEALAGDGDDWLNLIHVDDAAELLVACAAAPVVRDVELGCDLGPVRRRDYYAFIADEFGLPRPRFTGEPGGRGGSRRCDPASTRRRTGWAPSYENYRQGVRASIGH